MTVMKSIYTVTIAIVILLLCIAGCAASTAPVIKSFKANNTNAYPAGSIELKCEASDPAGGDLTYRWSSTGGSFTGSGSTITWRAPNTYGDYHIMVTVRNAQGDAVQESLTVTVIAQQGEQECSTCGK
jgi:hypothetical protein